MKKIVSLVAVATLSMASASVFANDCPVSHAELQTALNTAVSTSGGGLDFDMWGTVVNRDGAVCAVVKTNGFGNGAAGAADSDPWPGSRVISAQKANTANAFSSDALALSTANLFSAVQPGGSLYGLQHSNPVDPRAAYRGDSSTYGSATDPMNGLKVGGVNVFGGGLALYDVNHKVVGAIGVSGDYSCADHNIAWKTREALTGLGVANIPGGVGPAIASGATSSDNIAYPAADTTASGWQHVSCGAGPQAVSDSF